MASQVPSIALEKGEGTNGVKVFMINPEFRILRQTFHSELFNKGTLHRSLKLVFYIASLALKPKAHNVDSYLTPL